MAFLLQQPLSNCQGKNCPGGPEHLQFGTHAPGHNCCCLVNLGHLLQMVARMARAARLWVERVKEHVDFGIVGSDSFVDAMQRALTRPDMSSFFGYGFSVDIDKPGTGILQMLFEIYNAGGVSLPSWLRTRETMMVQPVLQIGALELSDAFVVWAGSTLHDALFVVALERRDIEIQIEGKRTCSLSFSVLPTVNIWGRVLQSVVHTASWSEVQYRCCFCISRLIGFEECVCNDFERDVKICFSRSAWKEMVLYLNSTAVLVCDENGVNKHFRVRVKDFIRRRTRWEVQPDRSVSVSRAQLARCLAWRLRKCDGEQLFGVYEDDNGVVRIGGF
jgi:hypothetical protein